MSARPIIRVKPKEGRRARAGSPWLFSNEIEMSNVAKALAPGAVVNVLGDDGRVFGTGYFNAHSLITVRLLDPTSDTVIDAAFFTGKFKRALELRQALYDAPFYRLVNAEGDALPGLVIDRFADTCVVQITTAGMEAQLAPLLAALDKVVKPHNVILRADAPSRLLEGLEIYVRAAKGETGRIGVEENGVRYFADMQAGQKTGW